MAVVSSRGKVWASIASLMVFLIGGSMVLEGGHVDDPNDPGGETNMGITEKVARQHDYDGPMGALPEGLAIHIYTESYILKPKFDRVLLRSPAVGTKTVDAGINTGPGRAGLWLQKALNDLSRGGRDYPKIAEDGAVGPATLAAFDALAFRRGREKACELTLKLMDAYQAMHYASLGRGSHELASFVVGWVDHRIQNVPLDRCDERVQQ